jgi:DNA primase
MNLLDVLPDMRRAGATNGGEFAGPCPWCGGEDRFRAWPAHPSGRARYWCRRCERAGDEISLLRELKGMTFIEAAAAVGQLVVERPTVSPRQRQLAPLYPPTTAWQLRAEKVAIEAQDSLWSPVGSRALDYLRQRGFEDATIRAARLGYVAADLREKPENWGLAGDHRDVWVPRGVSIPWRACSATWRLNIRRPSGERKYIGPAGSKNALYGADALRDGRPAVLVEGEFDALAVAQEAGDIVAAVATGSTHGARHPRWVRLLTGAPTVLVAYDSDEPGEQAAGWWLNRLPGSRRLVPEGDPAGMLEAGKNLRRLVRHGLPTSEDCDE